MTGNFQSERLNEALLGKVASALNLQTPALVLDLDIFQDNIQRMAAHCRSAKISLRPHAKTHKCAEIARRQIEAGAIGICCAKLGEAEVMVAAGIESVLLTSPVVGDAAIARLLTLNNITKELMVVVDNPDNAQQLSQQAALQGKVMKVILDLDPGLHRTGIAAGADAMNLADYIVAENYLEFMGIQSYAGHIMHIQSEPERAAASDKVMQMLSDTRAALKQKNIECLIVTGGGSGTFAIDANLGVLSELQAGSYIVMDRQYNEIEGLALNSVTGDRAFSSAMFVQMSVVSNNTPGLLTVDAGFKSFATDADAPQLCWGDAHSDSWIREAEYFFFGDEHGGIKTGNQAKLELGSCMRAVLPHCDPTINLYDYIHVIQGDTLVDIWSVDARGKTA